MFRNKKDLALLALNLVACHAFANHQESQHVVIAPKCLIQNFQGNIQTLSTAKQFALIKVNDKGIDQLIAAKKAKRKQKCGGFMDVTESWKEYNAKHFSPYNNEKAKSFLIEHTIQRQTIAPQREYKIRYEIQVNRLIAQLNPQNMWTYLTTMSSFPDRYSRSDNGVKAAAWLKNEIETIASATGHTDVTTYYVPTPGYLQPSVVVKIGQSNEPGIVIGGHMDTLSSTFSKKPGADDDGTGSVTLLEVARTLLASGMHFSKPIYVVWYAAEEVGLIGSQYVVKDFQQKNIPIDAVLQFDMTGFAYQNESTMWLMTDYVNKDLTSFLETLIKTYVKKPIRYTQCGYGCSDHVSWTQKGFIASFPFEAEMGHDNPYIHTSQDKLDILSLNHMHDFAKLAIAFTVELAEPV